MSETRYLTADSTDRRMRLEDFLAERLRALSLMYIRELVRDGCCLVNGRGENIGYRLRGGDFVEIDVDPARANALRPEPLALRIRFEDEHLIVLDKPAGMLVHPTHRDKGGTLLNGLLCYLNQSGSGPFVRPGLVHRLDKQTSGLMVVAKTAQAHRVLSDHFKRKLVKKLYVGLADGVVEKDEGTIAAPIGRFAEEKRWGEKADGKPAKTRYRVVERRADSTLLELEPVTGRTNQLRIHCAAIGHPLVGDAARGGSAFHRLCLHSMRIEFNHPASCRRVEVCSDMADKEFGVRFDNV